MLALASLPTNVHHLLVLEALYLPGSRCGTVCLQSLEQALRLTVLGPKYSRFLAWPCGTSTSFNSWQSVVFDSHIASRESIARFKGAGEPHLLGRGGHGTVVACRGRSEAWTLAR